MQKDISRGNMDGIEKWCDELGGTVIAKPPASGNEEEQKQ